MNYSTLGNTELKVPSLCFGTMTFGDGSEESVCRELYARCRDRGVNLFDCANVYADGDSERILGRLINNHRSDVVVATKAYYPMGGDVSTQGLGRSNLIKALHDSLKRLNTDYVDLFYLHAFDDTTPLDETLEAVDGFVRQGKIRYVGVSNFAAWQVMKALSIAEQKQYSPFSCIQPMYSLLKRQCESELLPMAAAENLGVLPYGPVAGGYLTGKYLNTNPADGRFSENKMYRNRYAHKSNSRTTERFVALANELAVQPTSLAIAWVASNPIVTAPIIGARNVDQLDTALASLDIEMSDQLRQSVSDLSQPPALATDRTEEQN